MRNQTSPANYSVTHFNSIFFMIKDADQLMYVLHYERPRIELCASDKTSPPSLPVYLFKKKILFQLSPGNIAISGGNNLYANFHVDKICACFTIKKISIHSLHIKSNKLYFPTSILD